MPYAVTHVLSAVILSDIYRDYWAKHKKHFSLHHILIAGLGGLLPDIDVPLNMLLTVFGMEPLPLLHHGGITHTLFFALFFFIPGLVLWYRKKHKNAVYFYLLAFGIVLHLLLDWFLGGGGHAGIMWLYPFSTAGYKIGLLGKLGMGNVPQALDAIILLGWLWHEEYKHKITDFI